MNDIMVSPLKVIQFGERDRIVFAENPRWQPIRTAPRDGSEFLAWVPYCIDWTDISGTGPIRICRWDKIECRFTDLGNYTIGDRITHWCSFPMPPSDAQTAIIDGVTGEALSEWDGEEIPL